MSTDNSRNLAALSKLMKTWPGLPIDGQGLVRQLNADGTLPPLFCVFNTADEPEKLASALDSDQPLIYGRSLHLVMSPGPERRAATIELGRHYASILAPVIGQRPIWIGANCQGVPVMMQVAASLRDAGANIFCMYLISGLPTTVMDVPALLIYGEDDPHHDPFRKDADTAHAEARRCFARYRREVLPGVGHGKYFDEGTVNLLASILQTFRDACILDHSEVNAAAKSSILG